MRIRRSYRRGAAGLVTDWLSDYQDEADETLSFLVVACRMAEIGRLAPDLLRVPLSERRGPT